MTRSALTFGFLILASIPVSGRASLITGVLNLTGTAQISFGSIGFEGNDFSINNPGDTQQGGFTALAGTTGSIQNLTNPPEATGSLDVPDFIRFSAAPNITITLTFLAPGIDGGAGCSAIHAEAGQECSPDLPTESPYNLQNTSATSSSASFGVLGTEVDSTTGNTIPITGTFTTPFSNLSFQALLAIVDGAPPPTGGRITTAFSAEFATLSTTREPSTLGQLMMGIGLVGAGLFCRKKFPQKWSFKGKIGKAASTGRIPPTSAMVP